MSEKNTKNSHRDKRLNNELLFQTMRNMDNLFELDPLEPKACSITSQELNSRVRNIGYKHASLEQKKLTGRNRQCGQKSANIDVQCVTEEGDRKNKSGYQVPNRSHFLGLSVKDCDKRNISIYSEGETKERSELCSITRNVDSERNKALSANIHTYFQKVIGFRTNRTWSNRRVHLLIVVLFLLAHPISLLAFALTEKSIFKTTTDEVSVHSFSGVNDETHHSFPLHTLSGKSHKHISSSIRISTNFTIRPDIFETNTTKAAFYPPKKYLYDVKPTLFSHESSLASVFVHPTRTFSSSQSLYSTSYKLGDTGHSDAFDGLGPAQISRYVPHFAALIAQSTDISVAESTSTNEDLQSEEPVPYNKIRETTNISETLIGMKENRSLISESRTKTQFKRQNFNDQKEGDIDQTKKRKMSDSKEHESLVGVSDVGASPFSKSLSTSQQKRHQSSRPRLGQTPPPPPPRTNIVEENPSLDVGPLVHIRVEAGHTARLPCAHRPQYRNDSARVVLWYRNDTTRPFLSHDGREEQDAEGSKEQNLLFKHYLHHHPGHRVPASIQNFRGKPTKSSGSSDLPWSNDVSSSERISLEEGGKTLVLKYVQREDQAEYRCTVHYQRSQAATQRMQLTVVDRITGLRMLDQAGRPVGPRVGPFSEGHRLLLTCRANFAGELKGLEWLVKGEPMPSSWASPRSGTAETHLDLTLRSSHDHSDLVCRLTTLEKLPLSPVAHDPTFYSEYQEQSPTPSHPIYSTSSLSSKEELETNETSNDKSTQTHNSRIVDVQKAISGVESPNRNGEYTTTETENKQQSPYANGNNEGQRVEGGDTDSFSRSAPRHDIHEAARKQSRKRLLESTITDVSILIQMYSMPVSRLTVLDAGSRGHTLWGGGGSAVEVREGGEITFKCAVKSRPPPYNITFMINGKVSPHTRGARDTLRLQPVDRRDSGLYTCLASNTEGDGHSNAILLKVIHSPYCQGSPHKKRVVARNTSVTLMCTVDAQPEVTTYNWVNADPRASKSSSRPPWELDGATLGTGSTLTLVPTQETTQVVCYAKNAEGYSQVPCVYTLTVVDPPAPPKDCYVNVESPTRLEVSCNQGLSNPSATAEQNTSTSYQTLHSRPTSSDTSDSNSVVFDVDSSHQNDVGGRNSSAGNMTHIHTTFETHHVQSAKSVVDTNELLMPPPSPGQLGFVRSSEVRPATRLEVWNADGVLLVNMSSKTPEFSVRGLPPSSELTLRLYSFAKEIVSPPVVLHTRTRAWPSLRPREEPTDAEVAQEAPVQPPQPPMLMWLAAAGAGALLLALVLAGAALVLLLVRRSRKRRRSNQQRHEEGSDGGEAEEGGPNGAGAGEGQHLESASKETVSMEESEFWIRPSGLQQPSLAYGSQKGATSSLLQAPRPTLEPSTLSLAPMLSSMATISLPPPSLTTMHTISVPTINYSFPTSMAMTLPVLPTVSTLPALSSISSRPALPNLFSTPSTSEDRGGLLPNS